MAIQHLRGLFMDNTNNQSGAALLPKISYSIIKAIDLKQRWPNLSAWALALLINKEIKERTRLQKYDDFPPAYRLITAQKYSDAPDTTYYLQFIYNENPFTYSWADDDIAFDFTDIIFEERDIVNY
jgi:hypothetical protein